jgi:hypothetical protein
MQATSTRRRLIHGAERILLGLLLVANAPVGWLITSPSSGPGGDALLGALWQSPWIMVLAKLIELTAGLCLLANRFVPLALAVWAPVLVNILGFQAAFSPGVLPIGLVLLALTLHLAWQHRDAFAPFAHAVAR